MEPREDPALIAQVREAFSDLQMASPMAPFSMEEKAAIRETILNDIQRRAAKERRVRRVRIMVGCSAAVAIGVGVWSVRPSLHSSTSEPTQVYATAPGQRASVSLQNGTRMILAPA
jgi:ferric-dicitrate binding protein FerR (iron transport regulator)